jgi:putative endopeptidase
VPTQVTIDPDDSVFDARDSDSSVDPVDDFYRFVNGGWIDSNPVPPEYGAWGAAQEVHERNQELLRTILERVAADTDAPAGTPERMVGTYYRSGMDVDRIEELDLTPIEGWLTRVASIATVEDVIETVAEFHRLGIGVLFDFGVLPDFEDARANLLYLGQSGLGLPDRDYYTRDDERSLTLIDAYRTHIANMFGLLGDEDAPVSAERVLDVERAIASLSYTNVEMRDVELTTNKYAVADLDDLMPSFGLIRHLRSIGAGSETTVNIDNERFYPGIDALITATPIEDWRRYLTWHLVRSVASSLPERFASEAFDFYGRTLGGQQQQKARWKRVLAAGSSDIGELIGQLYVAEHFPPEAKERMEHLVERLFSSMRDTIEALDWMGDETKVQALEKLDGFGYKIGYPDEWRDYTTLELEEGAWLDNRLAARRFEVRRQLDKLGEPVDPHEWGMAPHVVNAYYHPLRNEIVFPAGILQPPFFTLEADDAVNYGSIGAIIGHEITHGFDDQGSKFDAKGHVQNWWTDEDRTEFERRAQVMVEQFDAYEIEDGLTVNGELTLGENIADLGGLKIALAALDAALAGDHAPVSGLTPHQRFFIAWARAWRRNYTDEYLRLIVNSDPHAPSDLRCSGPLSNLDSFAEAFSIPDDHPAMRPPSDRISIW